MRTTAASSSSRYVKPGGTSAAIWRTSDALRTSSKTEKSRNIATLWSRHQDLYIARVASTDVPAAQVTPMAHRFGCRWHIIHQDHRDRLAANKLVFSVASLCRLC